MDATIKRASLILVIGGETYRGHNQALWLRTQQDGPDLLKYITASTPIRCGVATVGKIEFQVKELKSPSHSVVADATVRLFDEFNRPHDLRNRNLVISV